METVLKGRAFVFGDHINTDYIISGRYKFKTLDMKELSKHVMEDIAPDFSSRVKPGDFIVAGSNFGCGSSREQAPLAIMHAGVSAVIAKGFARIFFRNAINKGLPLLICDTSVIEEGDILIADLESGSITDETKGISLKTGRISEAMRRILSDGGLVSHLKKHGDFCV